MTEIEEGEPVQAAAAMCSCEDLSDATFLAIFSYLDADTLLTSVPLVCHRWRNISSDELLWRQKLSEYMSGLKVVTATTYPPAYQSSVSKDSPAGDLADMPLTSKDVYMRCSHFACQEKQLMGSLDTAALPAPGGGAAQGGNWSWRILKDVRQYLGSLLSHSRLGSTPPPYCCISGPGLNSMARQLIALIDTPTDSTFTNLGYFSSPQVMGIGSGMTIKVVTHTASDTRINLSILYTATKQNRVAAEAEEASQAAAASAGNRDYLTRSSQQPLRQGAASANGSSRLTRQPIPSATTRAQQRMESNLLFHLTSSGSFDLRSNVKQLLTMLNAFVFVVTVEICSPMMDTDQLTESLKYVCHELHCFAGALSEDRPVVVLACRETRASKHLSAAQVVHCMQLEKLQRPWLLSECVIKEMTRDLPPCLLWIARNCRY